MRTIAILAVLGLVLAAAALPAPVGATAGPVSAAYSGDWTNGTILIASNSTAQGFFRVRAEQADGTYLLVTQGVLPAGSSASVAVTGGGVQGNDHPAWLVEFRQCDGTNVVLAIAGAADDNLPWGWE